MENDLLMGMLAATIAEKCFHGRLPDAATPELVAVAATMAIPALHDLDDKTAEAFFQDLTRAVRRHIAAQNGPVQ